MRNGPESVAEGFTLLELIVILGIIGTILAIATPSFMEWRRNLQYKEAAGGIVSALRTARSNAIALNRQNRVEFMPSTSRYRITQGNRAHDSSDWSTVKQGFISLPANVVMKSGADCGGSADLSIQFNPNGTSSAGTICVRDSNATKYQILVANSGRIRNERK